MVAMEATEVMVDMDTARGPLMLMRTTAMEDMAVTAMAAMVDTDMVNGLLMLTTEVTATAVMAMASNSTKSPIIRELSLSFRDTEKDVQNAMIIVYSFRN